MAEAKKKVAKPVKKTAAATKAKAPQKGANRSKMTDAEGDEYINYMMYLESQKKKKK